MKKDERFKKVKKDERFKMGMMSWHIQSGGGWFWLQSLSLKLSKEKKTISCFVNRKNQVLETKTRLGSGTSFSRKNLQTIFWN